jgi:lipid-A-disaccharide synthase
MVVAGEISGDLHAARLIEALRRAHPAVACFGIGGDEMRKAGVEIIQDAAEMAVLGLWEVLKRYFFFRAVFRRTVRELELRRPDAVLLVDYPGFNLRLAAAAKARGVKVIYYICPQVWAWKKSRIPRMAKIVDHLLTIFPFEPAVFAGAGLRTDFVGHPLVDESAAAHAETPIALPGDGLPILALLPGSRRQELERILPVMWTAARRVEQRTPVQCLIAAASPEMANLAADLLPRLGPGPSRFDILTGRTRQILRQAAAGLVASGTATVEAALMGCPMVVLYRTSRITYEIGRRVVKVPHLGMVNLIAGRTLCPEFIQEAAQPDAIADAVEPLLGDSPSRQTMVAGLAEVTAALGAGGAAERAAAHVAADLGLA